MTNPTIIYPSKTAPEILMDEINFRNNSALDFNDFVFSDPEVVSLTGSDVNTKITITPKANTGFYETRDIFYKRLNLAVILSNPEGQIIPASALSISEIITQINTVFGIGLRSVDYVDALLPLYNVNDGVITPRVMVTAKDTSLLFYGAYSLALGPVISTVPNPLLKYIYYVHTTGYTVADYSSMIKSVNADGTDNTAFVLLRNASAITNIAISKLVLLANGDLVINGSFAMNVLMSGDAVVTAVNCSCLTLRSDGSVKTIGTTKLFGSDSLNISEDKTHTYKYVIDSSITTNQSSVYKYTSAGVVDTSYNDASIAITRRPDYISTCQDGKLYVVSPVFVPAVSVSVPFPVSQIRVDRLLANGAFDSNFNPVIITGNGSDVPLPVIQIFPILNNGFVLLFKPVYGVSVSSVSPVINGVPLVTAGVTSNVSWNPIVRFSESGSVDTSFAGVLSNKLDQSVFVSQGSNLQVGDKPIIYSDLTRGFLSYKPNPITGYVHRQPFILNQLGVEKLLSGQNYNDQFRWENVSDVINQPDGNFVAFGKLPVQLNDGTWGPTNYCIGSYNKDGSVNKVIYRSPLVDSSSNQLTMKNVFMFILPAGA